MKTRIITGVVALAIFIPFLIFSDTSAFVALTVLLSFLGAWEICGCMRQRKRPPAFIASLLYAVICPLFLRFATDFTKTFVVLTAVYGLWMVSYALFSRGSYSLQEASTLVTAVVYVVFGFCSAVLVRDSQFGFLSIWLIYIASWIPDTGAYFIGVRFGRHKLIPEISPHKTVEGFVGGLLCGMLIFLIYGDIVTLASSALNAHIIRLLLAGAVLSLLSVVGDLIASFIKRSYKIKDFGNLLPGHGGILDRFDSVLAVSIAMYAFSTFFPLFESV